MGLVAGALDAVGGGGWGPVGTTSLLSSGRLEPRKVVGSIDTSEFVVAVGGSLGFILALGSQGINWGYAGALLAGGVVAAPIAAWLVKHLAARVLGVAAGGLIVLTNSKTILEALGVPGIGVALTAAVLFVAWITGIVWAVKQERLARAGRRRRPTAGAHAGLIGVRLTTPLAATDPDPRRHARPGPCVRRPTLSDLADISDKLAPCAFPPRPTTPSGR